MSPEYGATTGFFPVDDVTLGYLRKTGRSTEQVDLVERYCKQQGLFRNDATPDPVYNAVLELDLGSIRPSVAGPRRPQDRIELDNVKSTFRAAYADRLPSANGEEAPLPGVPIKVGESIAHVRHGSVVIAAITSCTNTSNPSVMLGAGLLAKKAVERGLDVAPYVKTSLAPGSQVVTRYLDQSGLTGYLEALGFHTVGYGCTTCIGNSGPLPGAVAEAVDDNELVVAAVLSGNRNFEGRVHQQVRASFLASPPLVVAYALAGTVDIDLARDPLGIDPNGQPVYLADIWPTRDEVEAVVAENVTSEMFQEEYATVFDGDDRWKTLPVPTGELYHWDPESTYVQEPPYFIDMSPEPQPVHDIAGARVLVLVGDSVTTDHISPAGAIARTSPAAQYLVNNDVEPRDFNSYGSRRGNHEVMVRGTFANIRLRNLLVPGKEGNLTVYLPTGEEMSIYDASYLYQRENIPLLAIAGKEYGSGSSRDWAAKGPMLLGIKAIIAESYERIHRSNLIGMGVLPLQFKSGENLGTFGLNGTETFAISGIADNLTPRKVMTVTATKSDGSTVSFEAVARIDSKVEVGYYKNGGILQTVLRRLMAS
jgi:aconitate hydratase